MSQDLFAERRRRVLEAIRPGVLVLFAAPEAIRNNDVHHPYRQDSDVYYLTGYEEPQSALVLSSENEDAYALFVRPKDRTREIWDGYRAGVEGAKSDFGADAAYDIADLADRLPQLLAGHERVFYHVGRYPEADRSFIDAMNTTRFRERRGKDFPEHIIDSDRVVHQLRYVKSRDEVLHMQEAQRITEAAHRAAMRQAAPGMNEGEIDAVLTAHFRRGGAARAAYESIVASGPNATVLHYISNNRTMQDGELLLIDAGCEYRYYASDVTRTFPVNGKFSPAQRAVYEVVLQAELAAIAQTAASATLDAIHDVAVKVLTEGMIELGLIEGSLDEALEDKRYKRYYMHSTSHYLGMDVHDVGRYKRGGQASPLEAGVVITVEPGIYIAADDMDVKEEFRGIGIRIEDDVLVEENGIRILSEGIPKTIEAVEEACAEG
jgi:Xaa-Pro aminopeptidase